MKHCSTEEWLPVSSCASELCMSVASYTYACIYACWLEAATVLHREYTVRTLQSLECACCFHSYGRDELFLTASSAADVRSIRPPVSIIEITNITGNVNTYTALDLSSIDV